MTELTRAYCSDCVSDPCQCTKAHLLSSTRLDAASHAVVIGKRATTELTHNEIDLIVTELRNRRGQHQMAIRERNELREEVKLLRSHMRLSHTIVYTKPCDCKLCLNEAN